MRRLGRIVGWPVRSSALPGYEAACGNTSYFYKHRAIAPSQVRRAV